MVGLAQRRTVLPVGALVLFAACAGTQQGRLSTARDGHESPGASAGDAGDGGLHVWSSLTAPEVAALEGVAAAKQGDMHALLALAIVASASERDAASYATFQRRVDEFIASMQAPMAAAADDWHRGYELNRAMHRVFFNGEQTDLGSYELHQPRVTAIFTKGHYNCISSAMLFVVLARGFGLPVRGVLVPSHVFVEMGAPGSKIIEIETTSATGFDWIHDARFYSEAAAEWARSRGLPVTTLAGYEQRKILEPYQLMARAMHETLVGATEQDRFRLDEVAAVVDGDDAEIQDTRIRTYQNEAYELYNAKDWSALVKLLGRVEPAFADVGAKSKNGKTLEVIAWLRWDHAWALLHAGHPDEAVAIARDGLARLDASWPDAAKLRDGYLNLLVTRMIDLNTANDYPAMATYLDGVAPTVSTAARSTDAHVLQQVSWLRWGQAWALVQTGRVDEALAIVREGRGQIDPSWPDSGKLKDSYGSVLTRHLYDLYQKKQFREIVTAFGKYSDVCRVNPACLDNVDGAYVSLAIEPLNAGDWQGARQVLRECVGALPGEARCGDMLRDLESSHRF